MRIEDRFTVSLPIDETWKVFLDVERIAPCMPGAQLQEVTDEEYRGIVKIKLGAITAQYKGAVRFEEVDEAGHRMVLRAEGRETRGQGNAAATVVATLHPSDDGGTEVAIDTDLKISGRVAQFGRGVMADVSSKLLGEFARCLEQDLAKEFTKGQKADEGAASAPTSDAKASGSGAGERAEAPGDASAATPAAAPADGPMVAAAANDEADAVPRRAPSRSVDSRPAEPVDLLAVAGGSVAQRVIPAALVADLVLLAIVKGRAARCLLAAAGVGLVAGLVMRQE